MHVHRSIVICLVALTLVAGCHKPKPTILDNKKAMKTLGTHAHIASQAAAMALAPTVGPSRPAKLAQMLTDVMAVDPTKAFQFGVRALKPFNCTVVAAGITRCQMTFADVGEDGLAGYLDVLIRDNDVDFDTEFANLAKTVKVAPGQSPKSTDLNMTIVYGNGTKTFPSRCQQTLGAKNTEMRCMMLFDARTELVAGFLPQNGLSITIGNEHFEDVRTMQEATALLQLGAEELDALYRVPQAANGDYSKQDLHIKYGAIKYSKPGWYLTNMLWTSLDSGPYDDEATCMADRVRVDRSIAAQGAPVEQAPVHCVNYTSPP